MKKLNNKGMAISGILYTILVLFIVLLFGILSLLSSSKYTFDKIKIDVVEKIDGTEAEGVTSNECFDFDYSTGTITSYHSESPICSTDVVIPQSIAGVLVKKIADKSFYKKGITSVDFSNAVYLESIENGTYTSGAFASNSIETITFGKNLYLENIGNFAFYKNKMACDLDLSTLTSLKTIGEGAFLSNNITSVNFTNLFSLKTIGVGAFYGNAISGKLDLSSMANLTTIYRFAFTRNNITSVDTTNLNSLYEIGSYAFDENQIESFDFSNLRSLTKLGERTFSINKLKKVDLSNTQIKEIGSRSFADNEIEILKLPSTLKTLKDFAFYNNKISGVLDLAQISLDTFGTYVFYNNKITGLKYGGTTIQTGAFAENEITSIDMNNLPNVTEINDVAFYSNDTLTSINFRSNPITSIGQLAFSDCGLTSLSIPSTVTSIGENAFANNKISGKIDLSQNTNLSIGSLAFYNNEITDIDLSGVIVSIGGGAFNLNKVTDGSKNLIYARNEDGTTDNSLVISYAGNNADTITLSDEVTGISAYAFQSINANDIVFGSNVETIDDYAFAGFKITGALDLSNMSNLKSIGNYAFASNSYYSTVLYTEPSADTSGKVNNVSYSFLKYNTIQIKTTSLSMESEITSINFSGLSKLESIGENAFRDNKTLTAITGLEDLVSLTNIGKYAFYNHDITSDINLSNTKLTTILTYSFCAKSSKSSAGTVLTFPNTVTSIESYAFSYSKLKKVNLPENLISIGDKAFYTNKISNIVFPDTLETVGVSAFCYNSLGEVVLPKNLKSMGNYAFQSGGVTKVDFSNVGPQYKYVSRGAFHNNASLKEIILNEYLVGIYELAFDYGSIKEITIPTNIKFIEKNAFQGNKVTWERITIEYDDDSLITRFNNDWNRIPFASTFMPDNLTVTTELSTTSANNFDCNNKSYEITIPKTGKYKLEVWGAQGGDFDSTYVGGKGGYSVGEIKLTSGDVIYVTVGSQPLKVTSGFVAGGFNGGGYGVVTYGNIYLGGGGATDIRIGSQSKYARVIVAGGGSGSSYLNSGYAGGGTNGLGYSGYYGTQTKGGTGGGFGIAGNSVATYNNVQRTAAGGGGGWYGGGTQTVSNGSNGEKTNTMLGGGSGYVYTSSTATNYPSGCLLTSTYYLSNAKTIAGNASMPSYTSGGNMTGNTGDGHARITFIG